MPFLFYDFVYNENKMDFSVQDCYRSQYVFFFFHNKTSTYSQILPNMFLSIFLFIQQNLFVLFSLYMFCSILMRQDGKWKVSSVN